MIGSRQRKQTPLTVWGSWVLWSSPERSSYSSSRLHTSLESMSSEPSLVEPPPPPPPHPSTDFPCEPKSACPWPAEPAGAAWQTVTTYEIYYHIKCYHLLHRMCFKVSGVFFKFLLVLPLFAFLHWRASSASTSETSAPSLTFAHRCMLRCHCRATAQTSI